MIVGGFAVGLAACGGNVVVDGSGSSSGTTGAGGGGASGSSGGSGGAAPSNYALVTTQPGASSALCMQGQTSPVANPIFLIIANVPITCAAPFPAGLTGFMNLPSSDEWEVCYTLDANGFAPGTFASGSAEVKSASFDEEGASGSCSAGGALSGAGTVTVTQVNASSVQFSLSGVTTGVPSCTGAPLAIDGRYTAVRCP